MGKIGSAQEYEVVLADTAGNALAGWNTTLLPWSEVSWQRVRCGTSIGGVTVPGGNGGIDCCRTSGLQAWSKMLWIIRNGTRVWDGFVTGWSTKSGDLVIKAADRSALWARRLIGTDRSFVDTDLLAIFYQLLVDAHIVNFIGDPTTSQWPFYMDVPDGGAGTWGLDLTRDYRIARLDKLRRCIDELVDVGGLQWTVYCNDILFGGTATNYNIDIDPFGPVDPVVNAHTILNDDLDLNVDGSDVVTGAYTGDTGQGIAGFANIVAGTNTTYTDILLEEGYTDARAMGVSRGGLQTAAQLAAAASATPKVTLEKILLAPNFGSPTWSSTLSDLIPGSVYPIDFPDSCALDIPIITPDPTQFDGMLGDTSIKFVRLDQLDVTISRQPALTEKFEASFTAVGRGVV